MQKKKLNYVLSFFKGKGLSHVPIEKLYTSGELQTKWSLMKKKYVSKYLQKKTVGLN